MKRIYILLLACMGAIGVMAQGQKLKSRIIDKDYYPVDSAKVSVKGTNISTTTDKNGGFVLDNVPLVLDSIEVQKGKRNYSAGIPVKIRMRKAVMDRFAWFVRAGYEYPLYDFGDFEAAMDNHVFYVGGGIDLKMSRHWAFQPSLNLAFRKMNGYGYYYENGHSFDEGSFNMGVLEIPLLFAVKFPLGYSANLVFRFGTYFDIGLWGTAKYYTDRYYTDGGNYRTEEREFDIYGTRFCGGAAYGIGIELGHFLISTIGHTGWMSYDYSEGYTSFGIEVGYKF